MLNEKLSYFFLFSVLFSIFSVSLRWRKETPKFTTTAFAGFFLNGFPLNCIPCFLSGGDEKQTFTTAGYSHLSNSRGGGNKRAGGCKSCKIEKLGVMMKREHGCKRCKISYKNNK